MSKGMPDPVKAFWSRFLSSCEDPDAADARFLETFAIGTTPESADHGAALILSGEKTATSALLWEYETSGNRLPYAGALSILLDGRGDAICVVESTQVEVKPFGEVDESFTRPYGECDGSVEGWRQLCWPIYERQCRELGRTASMQMPLVCELLRVLYRE
jgi:uncharacterized protein YhfF